MATVLESFVAELKEREAMSVVEAPVKLIDLVKPSP